jgi:hypothetical protein
MAAVAGCPDSQHFGRAGVLAGIVGVLDIGSRRNHRVVATIAGIQPIDAMLVEDTTAPRKQRHTHAQDPCPAH